MEKEKRDDASLRRNSVEKDCKESPWVVLGFELSQWSVELKEAAA